MSVTPSALFAACEVHENTRIAAQIWRMRFSFPELAARILPGQFFMVRLAGTQDPLIGRAFAVYDTVATNDGPWGVDFAYIVKGNLTTHLCELHQGDRIEVWGPLGNGFPRSTASHLVMVAGGIGYTPFLAVAKAHLQIAQYGGVAYPGPRPKISFCYGASHADGLAGVEDFEALDIDVQLATDDGSRGHHGQVTAPLHQLLDRRGEGIEIYCCGPEPMMQAVADVARSRGVPCSVSLESPMACGIGICFSCVAPVVTPDGQDWDYARTCIDGPVFPAEAIAWDA
ncbi:MAG: dihydroorotate dehydrogenase electron transfer subunit [Planctomycetota bacterium]